MATPDVDEQRKKIQKMRKEAAAAQSANFSRVMNLDVKVDKDGTRATVILPGLSYDDFDRTGNFALWRLSRTFEFARRTAVMTNAYLDSARVMADRLFFLICGEFDISQNMYSYLWKHRYSLWVPLQTDALGLGNTSLTMRTTMFARDYSEPLVSLAFKYVPVDRKTRRAKKLPDWLFAKYPSLKGNSSDSWLKPLLAPKHVFSYKKKIEYSDVDHNGHANQSFYVRAMMDGAATACYANAYQNFSGDFFRYQAQKMWVLYAKETHVNEELEVLTWDSPEQKNTVYFQLRNEAALPVFHAVLRMHPTVIKKSHL